MELLTVMAIMVVLLSVAYPLFRSYKPDLTVRSGVQKLQGLLERARLKSATQNRPIRVVLNCTRPGGFESCFIDLQSAIFKDSEVKDWDRDYGARQVLNRNVFVLKVDPKAPHDGKQNFNNIFWAIFMPSGQVFSNPKPFGVYMYYDSVAAKKVKAWEIKVDPDNGRVDTRKNVALNL